MRKTLVVVFSLFTAVAIVGCDSGGSSGGGGGDGGGGGGGGGGDVAGSWNGTGNYQHNNVPITDFSLNLSQDGNSVSGSYSIKRDARPTMSGSLSGSVNGGNIEMTMGSHGYADGSYGGNSMNLNWYESGFGGPDFTGPKDGNVSLSR